MTARELHLMLDIELRKVNSNVFGNLEPQEKDLLLYNGMCRFIRNRINPQSNKRGVGFQGTKKRYDDLEYIQNTRTLPVYIYDTRSVYCMRPHDMWYSTSDTSLVSWDCADLQLTKTASPIYFSAVPLPSPGVIAPFYNGFKIEFVDINAVTHTLFDISTVPYFNDPTLFNHPDQIFEVLNYIRDILRDTNLIECRWERFNGSLYNSKFIFIPLGSNRTYVNGTSIKVTCNGTTTTYPFDSVGLQQYVIPTTLKTQISPNRLTKTNVINNMMAHSFGTSIYDSPLSTMGNGLIRVYHSKSFILNGINLEYIRRPKRISLYLNQSCELDESTHEEIVLLTAEKCKQVLNASDLEALMKENITIE